MEVNIYNVIWADDECATLKQDELIRKVFNENALKYLSMSLHPQHCEML